MKEQPERDKSDELLIVYLQARYSGLSEKEAHDRVNEHDMRQENE